MSTRREKIEIKERWLNINGYKISNLGDIIGKKGKLLSKTPSKSTGYLSCRVDLGETYGIVVGQHRVIALLFVEGYKDGYQVNHKDGNKTNNRADNLEWCTSQYNMIHVSENGLNPRSRECCIVDNNGDILKIYKTMRLACIDNNLTHNNITPSCTGRSNCVGGIRFRYYDPKLKKYEKTRFDTQDIKFKSTTRRKIRCIETNQVFKSQMEASRVLNIRQSEISDYLKGKRHKSIKGYTFEYCK